jgi:Leucine-rich repeat (LRR) protein
LPEDIGKLQQLRTLWLGNNKLKKLPREMVKLNNLEWNNNFLDLSSNIDGNPLEEPPLDVCLRGILAIKEYFGEKRETKREKVYK